MAECSDHEIIAANGSEETIINIKESDSEVATDPVVKSIGKMLQTKSSSSSKCNIYKVPENLLNVNSKSYTPQFISIGPFHHGNTDLSRMEEQKRIYLQSFLSRLNIEKEDLVDQVRSLEERARNCYAEPINMSSDDFVEMIIVDGCFVVEYCMRRRYTHLRGAADHLIHGKLSFNVRSDLIKLENQLPFFVLERLFELYSLSIAIPRRENSFVDLSFSIFSAPIYKRKSENLHYDLFYQECDHFVSLLWLCCIPPYYSLEQWENPVIDHKKIRSHQTANELHEAGIKFHRMEINNWDGNDTMSIAFKNGVLAISHIEISSDYETYLRNLIAFEQCHHVNPYVTHFAVFMDRLINTDKDVNLLIKAGIISNHLGSNEDVTKIFNNISKNIDDLDKNYFNDVYVDMHKYCKARWHRWMFLLRRDYFNTPWASISFVAAAILLILTLIQTVFSGLSIIK